MPSNVWSVFRAIVTVLWAASLALGLAASPARRGGRGQALLKAPVVPVPPLFDQAAIDTATAALDGIVEHAMERTGLPGVAVGVVYKDKVIYAKGFGVREVGKDGAIDPDTVFLLASVSKPIASTIVAKLVGDGVVKWDDSGEDAQSRLRPERSLRHRARHDRRSHVASERPPHRRRRSSRGPRLRPDLHPVPSRPAAARPVPRDLPLQQFRLHGGRHRRCGGGRPKLGGPCR